MTRRAATDAAAGPEPALALGYKRADGHTRRVLVTVDVTGVWGVYDVPTGPVGEKHGQLVDRLLGFDDRLGQALALAADYRACQEQYHAGQRTRMPCPDPLPKPVRVPLTVIRSLAARARRAVRRYHQPPQTAAQIAA